MLKKINRNILSTKKEQVKSVKKTQKTRSKNKPEGLSNLAKNASWWFWSYIIFLFCIFILSISWVIDYESSGSSVDILSGLWLWMAMILVIIWMYKTYKYLHKQGVEWLKHSPSRSIRWWIIPVANLIIPYIIIKDILNYYFIKNNLSESDHSDYIKYLSRWWLLYIVGSIMVYLRPETDDGYVVMIAVWGALLWIYLLIRVIRKIWSLQS